MPSASRRCTRHWILLTALVLAVAVGLSAGAASAAGWGGGGRSFGGSHFGGFGGRHFGGFGHFGGPRISLGIGLGFYDYYPLYPYAPVYPYPVYEYPPVEYPVYVYPPADAPTYVVPPAATAPAPETRTLPRRSELTVRTAGRDTLRLSWSGDARGIRSIEFALLDPQPATLSSLEIDVPPFVATLQTLPEATSASATVHYRNGETKTVSLPLRPAPRPPSTQASPPPPPPAATTPPGEEDAE